MSELPIIASNEEGSPLTALTADGNLNYTWQWRDRYGRWVEMGRGIKFKVRRATGDIVSVLGQFIGAGSPGGTKGIVLVKDDPNGFPDGFYEVDSANGQEILTALDPEYLAKKGIQLGKDVNGDTIGERADADVPNEADLVRLDAPIGWKKNADGSYSTTDGLFDMVEADGKWKVTRNRNVIAQQESAGPDAEGAPDKGALQKEAELIGDFNKEADGFKAVADLYIEGALGKPQRQELDRLRAKKAEVEDRLAVLDRTDGVAGNRAKKDLDDLDEKIRAILNPQGEVAPKPDTITDGPLAEKPDVSTLSDDELKKIIDDDNANMAAQKPPTDGRIGFLPPSPSKRARDAEAELAKRGIDYKAGQYNFRLVPSEDKKEATPAPSAPQEDSVKTAAKKAVELYDEDGAIAKLIDSGASAQEVFDALNQNEKWKYRDGDYKFRDMADAPSPADKIIWAAHENRINAINALGEKAPESEKPVGNLLAEDSRDDQVHADEAERDDLVARMDAEIARIEERRRNRPAPADETFPDTDLEGERLADLRFDRDNIAAGRLVAKRDLEDYRALPAVEAEAAPEVAPEAETTEVVDINFGSDVLNQVQDAIDNKKKIRFNYKNADGEDQLREVTPLAIETGRNGNINVLSTDSDGKVKRFTIDKMEAMPEGSENKDVTALPVEESALPVEPVEIDFAGDVQAQILEAIANNNLLKFVYKDSEGNDKVRIVNPIRIWENPKNGKIHARAVDADGVEKNFEIAKMQPVPEGSAREEATPLPVDDAPDTTEVPVEAPEAPQAPEAVEETVAPDTATGSKSKSLVDRLKKRISDMKAKIATARGDFSAFGTQVGIQGEAGIIDIDGVPHFAKFVYEDYIGEDAGQDNLNNAPEKEELAAVVANLLGIKDAPLAVNMGDEQEGMVVADLVKDADMAGDVLPFFRDYHGLLMRYQNAQLMGLLDVLIVNEDRHGRNYFIKDGKVIPIDHGGVNFAKLEDMRRINWRDGFWKAVYRDGNDKDMRPIFSKEQLEEFKERFELARPMFQDAGREEWLDNLMSNLDKVIEKAQPSYDVNVVDGVPQLQEYGNKRVTYKIEDLETGNIYEVGIPSGQLEKGLKDGVIRFINIDTQDDLELPVDAVVEMINAGKFKGVGTPVESTEAPAEAPEEPAGLLEIPVKAGEYQIMVVEGDPEPMAVGTKLRYTDRDTKEVQDVEVIAVDNSEIQLRDVRTGEIMVFSLKSVADMANTGELKGIIPTENDDLRTIAPEAPAAPATEVPAAPAAEDFQVWEQLNGPDARYVDSWGRTVGKIELNADPAYSVYFFGQDGHEEKADFASLFDARAWLGDRIAADHGMTKNPITNRDAGQAPQPENVFMGADLAPANAAQIDVVRTLLQENEVPTDVAFRIRRRLDEMNYGEAQAALREIAAYGNKANVQTKPRNEEDNVAEFTKASEQLLDLNEKDKINDPNLIMQDVRNNHPNHVVLQNGDIVLEAREVGGKRYEVIVRRTQQERFYAFVREVDLATGKVRAVKMGSETHSYKALISHINKGKSVVRANNPEARVRRMRKKFVDAPQVLNGAFDPLNNPVKEYLDNLGLAQNKRELADGLADLLDQAFDNMFRVDPMVITDLAAVADREGFPRDFVNNLLDNLRFRKLREAGILNLRNFEDNPSHLDANGQQLREGDWVDWPQWDPKLPGYGQVFRGQVKRIKRAQVGGGGNVDYVYSDYLTVVFPEYNKLLKDKKPNSRQRDRVSANLIKVGRNDALSDYFEPKVKEAREQEDIFIPEKYGVPANPAGNAPARSVPKPASARPKSVPVENVAKPDGTRSVPVKQADATEEKEVAVLGKAELDALVADLELQNAANVDDYKVGDVIVAFGEDGAPRYDQIIGIRKNEDGSVTLQKFVISPNGMAGAVKEMKLNGVHLPPFLRPAPQASPIGQPVDEAEQARRNFEEWRLKPVNGGQIANLREALETKKLSASQIARVEDMINNWEENLVTQGEAFDLLEEVENVRDNTAKQERDDEARLEDAIGLARSIAESPNTPEESAQELNEIVSQAEKLASNPDLPAGPDAADPYEGYGVKKIGYDDVVYKGKNPPFVNVPGRVQERDFQLGDMIPHGVGDNRVYYQVIEVNENGRPLKYRIITGPHNNRFRLAEEGRVTNFFPRWHGSNIKRPSKNMADDYFNPVAQKPEPGVRAAEAPRNKRPYNPGEGREFAILPTTDDPEIQARAQALLDAHFGDSEPEIVKSMADGAMNLEARIMQGANGKRYFIKRVRPQDLEAEILNNRVALALGITDVVVIDAGDGATLLMDIAPGKMAKEVRGRARAVFDFENFKDLKNAKLIGILDYINENGDRHHGNWFVAPNGEPVPIDHGFARFGGRDGDSPFAVRVRRDAAGVKSFFTKGELYALRDKVEMLKSEFENLGKDDWYDTAMRKLNELIRKYGY